MQYCQLMHPNKAQKTVPSATTPRCQRHAGALAALHGRGFSVIESIVVLAVIVSLMTLGARYLKGSLDQSLYQATANHLKKIDQAAIAYVKDRYVDFSAEDESTTPKHDYTVFFQGARSTEPKKIAVETLIKAGYLPVNMPKANHYQQHYNIQVTPQKQGERALLQVALVTQEGQAIDESAMRKIADLVGGQAGYASTLSPDKITGSQGGWEIARDELPIEEGHLATITLLDNNDVMDAGTFLRRIKVDEEGLYNTMETDLKMKNNQIVHENGDYKAFLKSNQLKFTKKGKHCDYINISLEGEPIIEINPNSSSKKITLGGGRITVGGTPYLFSQNTSLIGYSFGSKFSQEWNKVPYHAIFYLELMVP